MNAQYEKVLNDAKEVKAQVPGCIVSVVEKYGVYMVVVGRNRRQVNEYRRKGWTTYEFVQGKLVKYSTKVS